MKKNRNLPLSFTKMQALGNDFIVIDGINQTVHLTQNHIQKLADRHIGIGCDQLLLIEQSKNAKTDFYYRIFNADGTEVAQCGNGARCVALFVNTFGLTTKNKIKLQTHERTIECHIKKGNNIQVNMGPPEQTPSKIPFTANEKKILYTIEIDKPKMQFEICPLSMGNPHCVLWVKELNHADVKNIGALLTKHPRFPEKTNVDFTQVLDRTTIAVRVFERGVGETLACGSAACAAMVASKLLNLVDSQVNVLMNNGKLIVEWKGGNTPVWLTGPARFVFNGKVATNIFSC